MHPALDEIARRLAAVPEVRRVLLYGSRARGNHGPRSDIDLAVECRGTGHRDADRAWFGVEACLEDQAPTRLENDLLVALLTVDLQTLRAAPSRYRRGGGEASGVGGMGSA